MEGFNGPGLEMEQSVPLTFHRPELKHMATPKCKEYWGVEPV